MPNPSSDLGLLEPWVLRCPCGGWITDIAQIANRLVGRCAACGQPWTRKVGY